ncbi:MAG: hypothetical protein JKX70_11500 [Phycisphaerales bacterium]|nr:hypothetical protein [Phycisphaerales bacterium]
MHHQHPIERATRPIPLDLGTCSAESRLFFGGSFDPPHLGHAALPRAVADRLGFEQVIYVPAARSPFKDHAPLADHHRLAMLKIALRKHDGWAIWEQELADAELNSGEPSYWADTWAIIAQMKLPGTNRFLIGADQARSMHRWHRYTEFWRDAVVMLRDELHSIDGLLIELSKRNVWSKNDLEHWREQVICIPTLDASSTAIRKALADPSTRSQPIEGLDARVQSYIIEFKLYDHPKIS